jgi:hypothetical protein
MKECRLILNIKSVITLPIKDEPIEDFIEQIGEGYCIPWIEQMILNGVQFDSVEVEDIRILGGEPEPDEELNFDM